MTGWLILGGFLAYWYLLKKGTTQSLVTTIRNQLSNFCAVNQAGVATGAVTEDAAHESSPGACAVPLGITTAKPGSMENLISSSTPVAPIPSTLGTVPALTGSATVPVGSLKSTCLQPWQRGITIAR